MLDFTPGQRWISDSEPELGLGLIVEVEHRMLTLEFPQAGETRLYAKNSAPLTRIHFMVGDEVQDREGSKYRVEVIEEVDGLLVYQVTLIADSPNQEGNKALVTLPETGLNDAISLNQPLNRLISGQVDHSHWFQLRAQTLETLNFIEKSALLGLCSSRTELIPHQLYIANEVAQRHAPRVLLADEVGLGKTIEACLILQQQLFSGLSSRVLIIVPESLVHQWLVELLRRFNLAFSIFDEERCQAITEDSGENPFFTEQLILCSSKLFIHSPELHSFALAAEWDLLIVDEAHHLRPAKNQFISDNATPQELSNSVSTAEKSTENIAYDNIAQFSQKVKGIILLTATPDQLGQESHFSLLRLLDPSRFHSFTEFVHEQNNFIQIAELIESLEIIDLTSERNKLNDFSRNLSVLINDPEIDNLLSQLNSKSENDLNKTRQLLISAILDRHGTGRILFRNTRKVVAGFPKRKLHAYPLDLPDIYKDQINNLQPELKHQKKQWLNEDPRVTFIEDFLIQNPLEKVLLICAKKTTVIQLEEHLRLHKGVKSSIFHEDMSIIERDRSAAYFSNIDSGSQILLCSEIGSEGRNFQFSQHLILFDLPINPDLLEQRIGRLDRIGQKKDINIHVPYLTCTAQQVLFNWHKTGLNSFAKTNPAAYKVFQELRLSIESAMTNPNSETDSLIETTQSLNAQYQSELQQGRDRLLEINSFNAELSEHLIQEINTFEKQASPQSFLTNIFDNFGIESEENIDHSWVIKPGDHMVIESFPAIPDQGLTLTYLRELALHREDVQFINWFHPIIEQSIDLVLQGDFGKSSLAVMQDSRLESGSLLLESLYRVEVKAEKMLQAKRFLPSTSIRVLVDSQDRNLSNALSTEELNEKLQHIDKAHLLSLLADNKSTISQLSSLSEKIAKQQLPAIINQSNEHMLSSLSSEIKRLTALKQVNQNIRATEIEFLSGQVRALHKAYTEASLQLEGIRLIFIV